MLENTLNENARKLFAAASEINTLVMFIRTQKPFITKHWSAPPYYSTNEAAWCEQIAWAAETLLEKLPEIEAALQETKDRADDAIRNHERNEIADVLCGNRTVDEIQSENAPFVEFNVLDIGEHNAARKPYFERRKNALAYLEAIAGQAKKPQKKAIG